MLAQDAFPLTNRNLFEFDDGHPRFAFTVNTAAKFRNILHPAQMIAYSLFQFACPHAVNDFYFIQSGKNGLVDKGVDFLYRLGNGESDQIDLCFYILDRL